MRALENINHPFLSRPHACLRKYQPPLISLVPPCLRFLLLSRSSNTTPSISLATVWTSVLAQWPRRGLNMSEPRRGGPSSPRHGGTMEPTATVTGGPARQAQHEWLPDEFGSLSQSCGRCLLVTSRRRHRWPGAYKCRPAAAYKRCRAAASGELHTSKEMLCCAESTYFFQVF
jgi:hypothetical protein